MTAQQIALEVNAAIVSGDGELIDKAFADLDKYVFSLEMEFSRTMGALDQLRQDIAQMQANEF